MSLSEAPCADPQSEKATRPVTIQYHCAEGSYQKEVA